MTNELTPHLLVAAKLESERAYGSTHACTPPEPEMHESADQGWSDPRHVSPPPPPHPMCAILGTAPCAGAFSRGGVFHMIMS